MPNMIQSDWKTAMGVELGGLKAGKIMGFLFISIGAAILVYGLIAANIRLIIAGIAISAFFLFVLVITIIKPERELYDYQAVEEIVLEQDGMTVKTAGKKVLRVLYEDVGLIVDITGFLDQNGRIRYNLPSSVIVYYDRDLRRCVDLWVDKDAGYRVIMEYKEYAKRAGIPLCPFITGAKENSDYIYRPIEKIKLSAFCRRWYR